MNVLLGVSGGIAAYKSPDLVRRLRAFGAEVRVVLTQEACRLVSPLSLEVVSGHSVFSDLWTLEGSSMSHIELARWADQILIAPATANLIAKLSHGIADDLLTTLCLVTEAPITLAPAMNRVMWAKEITQENCQRLRNRGVTFLGPDAGEQACGEVGEGRMRDPQLLASQLLEPALPGKLDGVRLLITAGPTHEPIDPVRFIGNRSSGKMGFALAKAAKAMGAQVTLIVGPVQLAGGECFDLIRVNTAAEMLDAVMSRLAQTDLFIGAAAVADYRVENPSLQKMKKSDQAMTLSLVQNPDILAAVAKSTHRPFILGFAAETENLEANATQKRIAKGLDMIAANQVGLADIGFESDYNALTLLWQDGRKQFEKASKEQIAKQLMDELAEHYQCWKGK